MQTVETVDYLTPKKLSRLLTVVVAVDSSRWIVFVTL